MIEITKKWQKRGIYKMFIVGELVQIGNKIGTIVSVKGNRKGRKYIVRLILSEEIHYWDYKENEIKKVESEELKLWSLH